MKHASAKVRRKVKNKFVAAMLRISAIEEQRERSMRMRHGRKRAEAGKDNAKASSKDTKSKK